jgi:hypothetical protein
LLLACLGQCLPRTHSGRDRDQVRSLGNYNASSIFQTISKRSSQSGTGRRQQRRRDFLNEQMELIDLREKPKSGESTSHWYLCWPLRISAEPHSGNKVKQSS